MVTPNRPAKSVLLPTSPLPVLLAAASFYAIFIARTAFRIAGVTYFTLIDDAMVSMRYAQHLAQGFGLVWNVGDKPIEGFTNPGWMLLMAGLHALQIPAPRISLGMMLLGALVLLANVIAVHRICKLLRPGSRFAPLLCATATAFYFPLVFWSLRGMEVGLLALLSALAVWVAVKLQQEGAWRWAILLSIVFASAILVRMDAVLQVTIVAAYIISARRIGLTKRVLPLVVAVVATGGILVFQKAYFGDFLPNTYYQKVVGAALGERVRNGLLAFNDYATRDTLMLALVGAIGILTYKPLRTREVGILAMLFLVQCAYSISVGGDYAEPEVNAANRFITQGMPALIIIFGLTLDCLITDVSAGRAQPCAPGPFKQAALSWALGLATLIVISGQPWANWAVDNAPLLKADIRRVKVGLAIAANTATNATIAVHAAGQIPYFSGRTAIDLLGLNDAVVAKGPITGPFYPGHDKWNYDYSILQLKPDLVADNWTKLGDFMRGGCGVPGP